MITNLSKEIGELKQQLIEMGAFVESNVRDTFIALDTNNKNILDDIIERDKKTDLMEKEIESRCLRLLVTHNPRAKDFRLVASVLKIITDLERIGDHTEDISEIQKQMIDNKIPFDYPILENMYKTVEDMLRLSMDSFVAEDAALAQDIDKMDDIVDDDFLKVRANIIKIIKEEEFDPEIALDFLQIAKYVERIGDHAENISEWVMYAHTGVHPSMKEYNHDEDILRWRR